MSIEEIEMLNDLKNKGVLSEQEFNEKKNKILSDIESKLDTQESETAVSEKESLNEDFRNFLKITIVLVPIAVWFFADVINRIFEPVMFWGPIVISAVLYFVFVHLFKVRVQTALDEVMHEYKNDIEQHGVSSSSIQTCVQAVVDSRWGAVWDMLTTGLSAAFLLLLINIVLNFFRVNPPGGEDNAFPFVTTGPAYALYVFVVMYFSTDAKEHIRNSLESFRCPFCNAPMSYFQTGYYEDGEYSFMKRVERRENTSSGSSYTYTENVPYIGYTAHRIYQCFSCRKEHEVTSKEERECTQEESKTSRLYHILTDRDGLRKM
ncbi:MAG: SHOCT domain-containing protein [Clostridia bacterium]|nr:SHOCT domain-containing protein [Clostridia bacterium]